MRKLIFILLAGLFICSCTSNKLEKPEDFTGSLLWKVSGGDLEKPSYIMGTYHLMNKDFIDDVRGLRKALDEVERVVGEIDMTNMQEMSMKMMQDGRLSEEESYKNLLAEDEYNRLDAALRKQLGAGLDTEMGKLKPSVINSLLLISWYGKYNPAFMAQPFVGMDQYMQDYAVEQGKSVYALETIDEQMNFMFNYDTQQNQMLDLLCSLEQDDADINEVFDLMEKYYKAADLNAFDKLMNIDLQDHPCMINVDQFNNVLLKERNDNWMKKLPGVMRAKSNVVAVGAAHLIGEDGILYQLHQMGYKVEKVK